MTTPDNELKPCMPQSKDVTKGILDDIEKSAQIPESMREYWLAGCIRDRVFFAIEAAKSYGIHSERPEPRSAKWMEIETAPKDGTRVLICFPSGIVSEAAWGEWCFQNEKNIGWYFYNSEDPWYSHGWDEHQVQPTHWMPLPKAPGGEDE